ncbi:MULTISPECIES: hypothetical protein [unclassified Pseudofrankia]|nr:MULTISPECIES: hypothetical protein [unclassified Pseudofrankia]MDT3446760.1 hypothetical protein [Pseudofrankia sp. BMG5.37]
MITDLKLRGEVEAKIKHLDSFRDELAASFARADRLRESLLT